MKLQNIDGSQKKKWSYEVPGISCSLSWEWRYSYSYLNLEKYYGRRFFFVVVHYYP